MESKITKSAIVTMQGRTVVFEVREYTVGCETCGTIWYAGDTTGEHKRQMSFETVAKAEAQLDKMLDQLRNSGATVE